MEKNSWKKFKVKGILKNPQNFKPLFPGVTAKWCKLISSKNSKINFLIIFKNKKYQTLFFENFQNLEKTITLSSRKKRTFWPPKFPNQAAI